MSTETGKRGIRDVHYDKKTLIIRLAVILALYVVAGIATRIVPQGLYERCIVDGHTTIVEGSFAFTGGQPLAIWRWFTAPFESLVSSSGSTIILVVVCMLLMGGVMVLLDESKVMLYMVSSVIRKFGGNKYKLMYIMVAIMMIMGSTVSFYNQSAIFIPLAVGISFAVGWDSLMGIGMSFLAIAMGFSASTINPFTVAIPQTIAGLPVYSGFGWRVAFLVILYVMLCIFLRSYARKIDRDPSASVVYSSDSKIRDMFPSEVDEEILINKKIRNGALFFVASIAFVILFTVASLFIDGLSSLSMIVMIVCLTVGGIVSSLISGNLNMRQIGKNMLHGFRISAPTAIVIILIMGIRQIIVGGNIMDTLLYYAYNAIGDASPYAAIFVIWGITLALEFVVGSATTKAFLVLPLLVPLGNMIGLTSQTIVQAYIYGDSFSNAFYPTSTMLLLITGVLNLSLGKWYKWTWKLILGIVVYAAAILLFCVKIGYGPF